MVGWYSGQSCSIIMHGMLATLPFATRGLSISLQICSSTSVCSCVKFAACRSVYLSTKYECFKSKFGMAAYLRSFMTIAKASSLVKPASVNATILARVRLASDDHSVRSTGSSASRSVYILSACSTVSVCLALWSAICCLVGTRVLFMIGLWVSGVLGLARRKVVPMRRSGWLVGLARGLLGTFRLTSAQLPS